MSKNLTIGGIPLRVTGCIQAVDLAPLIGGSAVRGRNTLIPGTAGVIAQPRRITETKVNIDLKVFGYKTFAGASHPNVEDGVGINFGYLVANVVTPPTPPTATRTAALTWGSLTIATKPVQVDADLSPRFVDGPNMITATLRLTFPEGLFVLPTS